MAEIGIVLWIVAATAVGQVVAWTVEAIRRTPHGIAVIRTLGVVLAAAAVMLQLTHHTAGLLDSLKTRWLVVGYVDGFGWRWAESIAVELALLVVAVVLGAVPAHLAARRAPRDELRVETGNHLARRPPALAAGHAGARRPRVGLARRTDAPRPRRPGDRSRRRRAGRQPGLAADDDPARAGGLRWRAAVRRQRLVPRRPRRPLAGEPAGRSGLVFAARAWVLTEFLLVASFVTMVLAGLRAGLPSGSELTALLCTWVVVVLQVVTSAMRWSSRRPFSVDLRSARATPAPPLVMIGYSTKLAVTTTLTSLVFSGLARVPHPELSVVVAAPFVVWSLIRMLHARDSWTDPVQRAAVVTTVAG